MSALSIQVPFPVFQGRDGQPLENGYVWIGEPNLNPQTNPVVVYFDAALTIPAPQPLRTLNGYISRAGTPAQIYVDNVSFSILVQDSKGSMVYNFPSGTGIGPDASGVAFTGFKGQVGTVADLADDDGSDWIGFDPAGSGAVARSAQDKMRDVVSVKDFGAVGNNIADDGVAIQAAIDAVFAAGGGTVFFPNGVYISGQTLTLKYRVWLRGVSGRYSSNCSIRAASTLDGPLIVSDQVNGPIYNIGIDGNPQRGNSSGIENMVIDNASTLSMDCDAIRLTNAWTVTLRNAGFQSRKGFAGRILDCNTLLVTGCFGYGGWYCESMADSQFSENQFGPNSYPSLDNDYVSSIMWLSGTGGSGWLSLITNNFIYNAPNGIARTCAPVSGVENITCSGHQYTDQTPVIYENSGGTFGLNGDITYYIKVVDANTVKVALSRKNVIDGVYVTPAATGTGTQNFRVGGTASLFVNDSATDNIISGNRFDQSYWSNVYYRGTRGNKTIGNTVALAGRSNPVAQVGIRITNCNNESIVGNIIDGLVVSTYPSGTSNQPVGILVNAASVATILQANKYKNCATACVQNLSESTLLDFTSVFVNPYSFIVRTGSPALTYLTSNRRQAWALDSGTTESVTSYFALPAGQNTSNKWQVKAYLTNMGAGTGNVSVATSIQEWAEGENVSANESTTFGGVVTVGAQDILTTHVFSTEYTPENLQFADVTFSRLGGDASDTLPNDVGFLGLLFIPT
jgi:hypothetical protein